MRHWMKARTARALAMLFGLSLLLTACDVNSLRELLTDLFPPQAEEAAGDTAPDAGATDASEEPSEDADDAAGADDRRPTFDSNDHPANLRDEIAPSHRARKRTAQRPEREREEPAAEQADDGEKEDESEASTERRAERPRQRETAEPAEPAERETPADSGGQAAGGLSGLEQQVFDLLNAERRRAGLSPLQLDSTLAQGSRAWSRRMATEGFFAHDTSGNFAENIAFGYPTANAVHDGWMNSEGHRNNRMNSRYTRYGIGAFEQDGTVYWTERFQ